MYIMGYNVSGRMREFGKSLKSGSSVLKVATKLAAFANEVACIEAKLDYTEKECRALITEVFVPDDEFDVEKFSKRLAFALEQRGVTENYAAWCAEHGVSATGLYGFMKGDGAPTMPTFFKLCRELDVSPAWLMGLRTFEEGGEGTGV